MDIVAQAMHKREQLLAELRRLDHFLAVAYELQGGGGRLSAGNAATSATSAGAASMTSAAYASEASSAQFAAATQGAAPSAMLRKHDSEGQPLITNELSKRAPSGVGAETARIAAKIIEEASRPMATRELVSLVEAHGIEIGGKDKVATLSARLGNDAKRDDGRLRLRAGKWHLLEWLSNNNRIEATGNPTKEQPAASSL